MATVAKKEPNSDLYESEERNSQGNYSFVPDSGSRAGFDRARWSEHDMGLLFKWFDDPENHRRYNHGIKVKAIRALAETIPGKTDRQVQNKMTALENHYNQCKAKLKQGIPLTERDMESGITTAPAKVKSIFRYYYELDHILNGSSTSGSNNNSGRNENQDYDSSPRHHRGQRMPYNNSPSQSGAPTYHSNNSNGDRGRDYYSHNDYNGDKSYKYSSSTQRIYHSDVQRDALANLSAHQDDNSPRSSHSFNRHSSGRAPKHSTDANSSTLPLPSRNSDHTNGTSIVHHSADLGNYGDKPTYLPNSGGRVTHSSYRSSSRKDRRLNLEEEKMSLKRKRHAEAMEFANRQLEAEGKWRRQLHDDIQEDLQLRRLELQLRRDELNLLQHRSKQESAQANSNEQTATNEIQEVTSAVNPENVSNNNLEVPSVVQES